jgi:hypothetical protein
MIQILGNNKLLALTLAALVVIGGGAVAVPATVLDEPAQQTSGPSSTVSVQPAAASVDVGDTTTVDVVVDSADGGVGAYNVTVGLADGSVASITDVEFGGDPGVSETFGPADATTARAALADTDDTGSVTVLTVTIEGLSAGTTDVTVDVNALGTEDGINYAVPQTSGATLTVGEGDAQPTPATFEVSNLAAPDTVDEGDLIDVSADVTNTGDEAATQTVEFRLDLNQDGTLAEDEVLTSQTVELDAGETETVTFADLDTAGLSGTYDHGVFTDDDSATATIDVADVEPATFEVSNLDAPDEVDEGDAIDVSADVTNTGDESGTQTVEFRLDLNQDGTLAEDEALATQSVTLDPGETETVTFADLDTSGLDGEYDHGVFTDDDSATATIEVEDDDPADFQVSNLDAPGSATQGDAIDVSADVTNTGDETGTQTVEFRIDLNQDGTLSEDEVLTSQTVELDAGETETVTFADLDTSPLAAGTYTHGVFTDDDSATAQITIEAAEEPAPTADVTFENQTTDGTTVVVDSVTMSEGGFVAIHDSSLFDGNVIGSVIGVSDYLEPGTHEDVEVTLYDVPGADFDVDRLPADETLVAMPHLDTDGDEQYGFVATGGEVDGPYTEDGNAVIDTAEVTVEMEEPEVGYYQIDFIGGEPYEELGPNVDNGFYADADEDRLFRYAFGNTEEGVTELGTAWPSEELRSCVDYQHISQDGDTASITFTVNESCEDVTLSLAVYEKSEPGFDRDMVQVLFDSDTGTFDSGTHTLTVELPEGDDSDE